MTTANTNVRCIGLTASNYTAIQSLAHSPTVGWGRESEKQVSKLVGQDKDRLIGEAKLWMHEKQIKQLIHCFPSAGRCLATSWKACLQHTSWLLGKRNPITTNIPTRSPSFPQLLLLSTTPYSTEYSFSGKKKKKKKHQELKAQHHADTDQQ